MQKLAAKDRAGALAAFRDADDSDDKHRVISPALFAGVLAGQAGDYAAAVPYLERVATSAQHLPDKLMAQYANDQYVAMQIGEVLTFPLRLGSLAASLLLAQAYQHTGRLQEAIGLAQKLYENGQSATLLALLFSLYRAGEE
jgi:tetratricopeptide (TPR) repeat protein